MKEDFYNRAKEYFGDKYNDFVLKLNEIPKHGFFINEIKGNRKDILNIINFDYEKSSLNELSYYTNYENIGKTTAYDLGLIYPQDVESSFSITKVNKNDVKIVVDLCAAPGGKSINAINRFPNALFICNDVNYKRASILSSNLERLGLNNTIITNKKPEELAYLLKGNADLVILDAPCSGEGMIRKYSEILENYNVKNINELATIQKQLLENAYDLLGENGILIYSTCTYAFEEDEYQINEFINKHDDIELIKIDNSDNYSKLDGTVKLCPLNNTEGQYIAILKKIKNESIKKIKYLKESSNSIVKKFIDTNIYIDKYYLYSKNNMYYLSLVELPNLENNVLRYGIYLGELRKDHFEPSHCLYRSLLNFRNYIDLNEDEYRKYLEGYEIKKDIKDGYIQIRFKNYSLGYGKCSNGTIKNKYPKGLRRML